MNGFIVWFTGLSAAGKSTIAGLVAAELEQRGLVVDTLDGDDLAGHRAPLPLPQSRPRRSDTLNGRSSPRA